MSIILYIRNKKGERSESILEKLFWISPDSSKKVFWKIGFNEYLHSRFGKKMGFSSKLKLKNKL